MATVTPTDPGLTLADVQEVVQEAIANIPASEPGLTTAQIQAIIQAALPEPELPLPKWKKWFSAPSPKQRNPIVDSHAKK